ncbi:hypothetical protein [Salmonella phage SSBI34]|nr:hypothetical protein [Salmonella phage SSBI34]
MSKVTAEYAIRAEILAEVLEGIVSREDIRNMNQEAIAELWDKVEDNEFEGVDGDSLWEVQYDFRSSGIVTNLLPEMSRHYESDQVARETPFGWVSWTYWYGGGKHGNPEEIDWMEYAYYVNMTSKEVVRTEYSFTKVEGSKEEDDE